jgi:hypothetical protein
MTQCLEKPMTKQQLRTLFIKENNLWDHEEIPEDQANQLFNALYASSIKTRQKRKLPKYY